MHIVFLEATHRRQSSNTAKFFLNRRLFARTSFLQPGMAADVSTGGAADVSTGGGRLELANDAELKSRFAFRIAACWGDQGEDSPAWMYSQDLPVDVRACVEP